MATNQSNPVSSGRESQAGQHSMEIATFKNAFDGGTRPNRFVVHGDIGSPNERIAIPNNFMVKAASMPAQALGILSLPFRGRFAKLPGDRSYAEWTITVIDETTHGMRRMFEKWHEELNWHRENIVRSRDILSGTNTNIFTQWSVTQIDMFGNEIRCIDLHKCWPVEVGAIDLSYETADTITEYAITLAYDYLTLCDSSGDKSGSKESQDSNTEIQTGGA